MLVWSIGKIVHDELEDHYYTLGVIAVSFKTLVLPYTDMLIHVLIIILNVLWENFWNQYFFLMRYLCSSYVEKGLSGLCMCFRRWNYIYTFLS
jgi:hypothetical protein